MIEVLAIIAPIVAMIAIGVLYRSCLAGAFLLLSSVVAYAWFVEVPGFDVGILLYPSDVVAMIIVLAGLLRILSGKAPRMPVSAIIFLSILLLSFALGLAQFGKSAGVEFRSTFSFVASLVYFSSFRIDSNLIARLSKLWIPMALVIMLIAWFVWGADAAGLAMARKWIDADPTGVKFRVLNASHTYLIGVGLVMLLHLLMHNQLKGKWRPLLLVLGITVLVLQHRSVWIATLAALALVFSLARRGRGLLVLSAGLVLAIALAVLPLVEGRFSAVSESVSSQAVRATDVTKGTFSARLRAWDKLLADWQSLGLLDQLIGKPFGSGYARVGGSPHNCYLQVMYRAGYIGLLAMLWLYGSTLSKLFGRHRSRDEDDVGATALLFSLIVAQLLFFIPYSFIPTHGILMGLAIAYVHGKPAGRAIQPFRHLAINPASPVTDRTPDRAILRADRIF